MTAYYNECDQFAAQWLRNLITAGLIAPGDVDDRKIEEVQPDDLREYTQCHFFAGIGGWSAALRLAGWDDDRPVWTGSCPCQPFSAAGKQAGINDPRHLWPVWERLIDQCRPPVVFGEQVASAISHGWLDLVFTDMENQAYTCGAAVLGAHSVGSPHIRQRLWWVAHGNVQYESSTRNNQRSGEFSWCYASGWVEDRELPKGTRQQQYSGKAVCKEKSVRSSRTDMDDSLERVGCCSRVLRKSEAALHYGRFTGATNGFWESADWLRCRDGYWRPTEPDTLPLAHGVPARVGRLRAYGNAIVPQVAASFIKAVMEAM